MVALLNMLGYERVKIFYSEPAEHMEITLPYIRKDVVADINQLSESFSEEFTFTVTKAKNPFKMPLRTYQFETIASPGEDSGVISINFEEFT
jgi:hypothetical protein